ncbi:agouti signaling protein 1 [Myripristis murdjan]|uniref:agouti signaling protein 1 n=1 Tax=Myripristis murdjan TaxID=586833 RepID=UPI001175DF10|nr:agouti-signaling protein [Myripristis murdjan]XP_029908262.1 agouti-signaling protein [Myripristis murdjan]
MHACLLIVFLALATTGYFLVSAHMIPEDRLSNNRSTTANPLSQSVLADSQPVVIVELPKSVRKPKKVKKQKKQNKLSMKKLRPPPPPNCVPLWGSCKSPDNVCCEFCAFCQCRLFKTVCYCRMGNPRC